MTAIPKNVVFLIGAGASIPAGMPSTTKITEAICSDQGNGPIYGNYPSKICSYIRDFIKIYYLQYFGDSMEHPKDANYEDVYSIIKQIRMSFLTEYPNPIIKPFIDCHGDRLLRLSLSEADIHPNNIDKLFKILDDYVLSVLTSLLNRDFSKLNGKQKDAFDEISNFWNNVEKTDDLARCDVFTVNHDDLIECMLFRNSIQTNDGFVSRGCSNYRIWNPENYENNNEKIHIYKLHGSISWSYNSSEKKVVIEKLHDYRTVEWERGSGNTRPEILVGTFDKMLEYTGSIFTDLFWHFKRVLDRSNIIIVCGYGFRDKGINNYLISWLMGKKNRKIIIVHRSIRDLMAKASPAIERNWKENNDRFIYIPARMETITWDRIKNEIKTF